MSSGGEVDGVGGWWVASIISNLLGIISFPFMLSTLVRPLNISSDNIAWLTRRHRTRTASSEYLNVYSGVGTS